MNVKYSLLMYKTATSFMHYATVLDHEVKYCKQLHCVNACCPRLYVQTEL